jgi:CheY-like chemotaxis protein
MENQDKIIKVFCMEGDEFFRLFLQDTLIAYSPYKISMTVAATAEDAINGLNGKLPEVPDVIFLCLSIPPKRGEKILVLGGFEVLENLRQNEKFAKVPIIIFSKYGDKKLQNKAKMLGATKYLVKGECMPKDIASLVASVGKF